MKRKLIVRPTAARGGCDLHLGEVMLKLALNDYVTLGTAWTAMEMLRMRLEHPESTLRDLEDYDRLLTQVNALIGLMKEIETKEVAREDNVP